MHLTNDTYGVIAEHLIIRNEEFMTLLSYLERLI